ncbi:MAG: ABC transporter substrate-binding protein, partial [Promethearchaeota archaeon]
MKTIRRVKSKIKIEDVVIGLLLFGLILNIGFNINLSITKSGINIPQPFTTLFIGYGSNPAALDPVDTWDYMDRPSREMQRQVTQSLVEYDLSSQPQYQLKPVLAEYWIWESLTRISFKLRKDVYFHDGTRMTAEDLKWNFERLKWFCNDTGDLPANSTSWEGYPSSLFYLTNGTFIFNSFEANDITDPLNFTINLNTPFAPLLDLLAFGTSNILSPRSTPRWKFLDLA